MKQIACKATSLLQWPVFLFLAVTILDGCAGGENGPTDTIDSGTIHISADESFKPVIDSQVKVFEASYPDAHIIVHYKPEADCFRDFAVDSIRMVIATRGYTPSEEAFLNDSMHVVPSQMLMAKDAIAVIVNRNAADTLFTMDEIRQILTGTYPKKIRPVFDGVKATSTVRFIVDSVLHGGALSKEASAARSSQEVLDYVAKTPDAMGFIGVNWIGNPEDSTQLSFLEKVKVAQIESVDKPGAYIEPVQANIYAGRYPMVRDLYYILKERHNGLGHGFAHYLVGQRGQLVFWRAYLMPAQMNFNIREASLSED